MTVTMPRRSPVLRRAGLAALLACALGAQAAGQDLPPYPNTNGFGVDFHDGEEWHRQCMRVAGLTTPPPSARPACDATELYYLKRDQARTSPAEWRQVHACARASGDDAVLMMLHANGYGAPRDIDRAIHHACRLDAAKAEMEARVTHLSSGAVALDDQPFDLCDHITSGRMGAVCAAIGETRDGRVRKANLERFAATLPPAARAPFTRLRAAAAAFTRKSADEVDRSGTAGAARATRHAGRREQEFVDTVLHAAGGKLARASAAQLAALERELDERYRALLARPSNSAGQPERIGHSTATRDDVRGTERLWRIYRDAWAAYLAAAGASADLVSVQAQLTRQRIAQLQKI